LVQKRHSAVAEFQALLALTIEQIEELSDLERPRWLDLLTYLHALVYNCRGVAEHPYLESTILESVHTDIHRRESGRMAKTIAEALAQKGERRGRREGELRARRETLLRQLRHKFADLPFEIVETIETTQNVARLDEWLDRVLAADSLADMRITPGS
jgi:ElaB/YqjD/DUF883 family membrane-anchored ribosome-binding protein